MTTRNKKLKFIQLSLLIFGIIIILITYINNENIGENKIFTPKTQKILEEQLLDDNREGDIFYNIEYSGLDISGNRYILKSSEAFNNKLSQEEVNLKLVEAIFYFKDDTILYVWSDEGKYNNRTLDMNFIGNVKAIYEGSELYANKANYLNSTGFLNISEKVKIKDKRGTMFADELLFDIKNQTLNIASNNDSKINADLNIK
jgi:hypothetical protein